MKPPASTHRRRRRALLRGSGRAAALAVACVLGGAATARAGAGAIVHTPAGPFTVTAGQITAGDVSATYFGGPTSVTGSSISSLLGLANVDLTRISLVTVSSASLTGSEITAPSGSPAFIAVHGGRTIYCPPSSGPTDVSAGCIQTTAGQPIDVTVQSSAPPPAAFTGLQVTASASPTVAGVGQTVTFAAFPADSQLTYSWSFADGATAYGSTVTHAYAGDGDYQAHVNATNAAGASANAQVTIHVGNPKRRTTGTGLGSSNATGSGSGGQGSGHGGSGGGNGTGGKAVTQPRPAAKPTPKAPAQTAKAAGAAAAAKAAAARARASQAVSGVLLADVGTPFDLRLSAPPPSGSPGAAHKSTGGGTSFVAVIAGLAIALVIATLGGVNERRRGTVRPA